MKMIRTGLMMLLALGAVSPRTVKAEVPLSVLTEVVDPQVKDDLFAGIEKFAQGATDVTDVNLDKSMLGMVSRKEKDGKVASKLEFIVVHSYAYDKPGMYRMEDFDVFRKRLQDGSWNCSIHTRDKDGSTDICSKSDANGETTDMVVMTAEAKELTFVHMRGHGLSFNDLGKAGGMAHHGRVAPPAPPAPPVPPSPRTAPAPPAGPR